ncbi:MULTISPECIES: hypothetical protein [Pontibacillus]|uniref:Uncharacterized protein n=1 Tax=Pontibacillus chungwhensis TaxID=265426 RepID=A0ABY8UWA3_9BACI|nr:MULTISPECIES: hypothetical protein [Pontibacillus]MCD5323980.1 hypothetical protein [Pontibacillus sp. HN14]WIF97956.1 hypothetical protein QNI29_19875 [Pontibacillus chungwhensis]
MTHKRPYSVHRRHLIVFFQTQEWVKNWRGASKPNIQTLSLFTGYSEESIIESMEFGHPSLIEKKPEFRNFVRSTARV